MVQEFLPKKPFHKRYEFLGKFSKNGESTQEFQIALQFPATRGGPISGQVLGTKDDYESLAHLFSAPGPLHKLTSTDDEEADPCGERITSFSAMIERAFSTYFQGRAMHTIRNIIGEFVLHDVQVTQLLGGDREEIPEPTLRIFFYLDGPEDAWQVYRQIEHTFTGGVSITTHNSAIDLGPDAPAEVALIPQRCREAVQEERSREVSEDVMSVSVTIETTAPECSEADLVRQAKGTVDDLCLLASFLSQQRVTWFRYAYGSNGVLHEYSRSLRPTRQNRRIYPGDSSVKWEELREFFRIGLKSLHARRAAGMDVTLPIIYYADACTADHIEQRFMLFFLALEKLKDLYLRREGAAKILSNGRFRKLQRKLRETIATHVPKTEQMERLVETLPTMNRPALRRVLEDFFASLDIEWSDLYPDGSSLTLIKTRNLLFHSSSETNFEDLEEEANRAQALVERVLLRLLGWKDLSCAPRHEKLLWLQGKHGQTCSIRLADDPDISVGQELPPTTFEPKPS